MAKAARWRRSAVRLSLAVAAALPLAGTLSAQPAYADIDQQIRQAQQQLDGLNQQAEMAAEQYNAARMAYEGAQQRSQQAAAQVQARQQKVDAMRSQVAQFAAQAYRGSGAAEVLMLVGTNNPQQFLDKATTLDLISRAQGQALANLTAARLQAEEAKSTARQAETDRQAILERADASKQRVSRALREASSLLTDLQAKQAELIRQAKARAAQEAAQKRAAELAAQAAATRQAAASFSRQGVSTAPPTASAPAGDAAAVAVQWAYRELGKPYVYGAAGPDSFDCSGLTQFVYGKAGVYLPHYTGSQWNSGRHVSFSELKPGDLVFFYSDLHHVGIYIGDGKMIHAPQTGDVVKITALSGSRMDSYAGAVRVVG